MTAGSIRANHHIAHCVILMSADHTATHPDVANERLRSVFVARLKVRFGMNGAAALRDNSNVHHS